MSDALDFDGETIATAAEVEAALRVAATALHKIAGDRSARRLLDREGREGRKLPSQLRDNLTRRLLDADQVEKIAADGFEACLRALAVLGATDITIRECDRDLKRIG